MYDSDKDVIYIIEDYANGIKNPSFNCSICRFNQYSYSHWAVNEILIYILTHVSLTPIQAIKEFKQKMDKYSILNPVFSFAYDVATDIYNVLSIMS